LLEFISSFFANPSAVGISLAVAIGAAWLAAYWPPLRREAWLWVVLVTSALITLVAVSFIQIPLQSLLGQLLAAGFGVQRVVQWLLLAGIPGILVSGFVQEGAKLSTVWLYLRRFEERPNPRVGLIAGAVAGAGFAIFEAQWVFNSMIASGWGLEMVVSGGPLAIAGLIERFFTIALHISVSAVAGYGFAKGQGVRYYVIASCAHSAANYSVLLVQSRMLSVMAVEAVVGAIALVATGLALWLRWKKQGGEKAELP